jgi:hypothetical protein
MAEFYNNCSEELEMKSEGNTTFCEDCGKSTKKIMPYVTDVTNLMH